MTEGKKALVLVTGGSGFVAAHCILQCLAAGYAVRTTVRTTKRESDVLSMLKAGEATNLDQLSFAVADLTYDEGWAAAVKGCTYVLHVASPFPPGAPKHEDDLIIPARQGTLRVLRAARDADVKRVVVTSSMAAIGGGHDGIDAPLTEEMWTDVNSPGTNAYMKSKTLAERAAWEFMDKDGGSLELAVVNPGGIFGPVLGPDFATSIQLVQRLMNGALPGCPKLSFGIVDVRDVADLHLRAMTDPKAKGQRFLCVATPMTIQEISLALRDRMGDKARKCPTRLLPSWLLRVIAYFDPTIALILPELDKFPKMSSAKAREMLGWDPRSSADALVATAESLVSFGLVNV